MAKKIFQLAWENFGTEDMKSAFEILGNEVTLLKTSQEELLSSAIKDRIVSAVEGGSYDLIFGFNYFPEVAKICNDINMPYYAWVYDNPCVQLYSYTVIYPTNHIFVFDSDTYIRFNNGGISTINFLPMASNPERLNNLWCRNGENQFNSDISFVGALYNEEHNFYSRMIERGLDNYTDGYIRGLMEAQKLIYGRNIIEPHLGDNVISAMHEVLPLEPDEESTIEIRTLFSEFVLNRQITAEERKRMLSLIGRLYADGDRAVSLNLYTRDKAAAIPGWKNNGSVDFYEEAPLVFHNSGININISLRSIVNGIPLRCFEIMGSNGFLLTDFRGDFELLGFTEGEDFAGFDSVEEMLTKCDYYLNHESVRKEIVANALDKIRNEHTYVHRAESMLLN